MEIKDQHVNTPTAVVPGRLEEFAWSPSLATVATCNLKQWALDFDGNLRRTVTSIERAKHEGAKLRIGPELELSGYGCEDHFLEDDTVFHCWESLAEILATDITDNILCDIGMPVVHKSVRYNARITCLNRRILLIRPKTALADDTNHRESRWFTAWSKGTTLEDFDLPRIIQMLPTNQHIAPIGLGVVACNDCSVASESCEELYTPKASHVDLSLDGVDILTNGSSSFHQFGKLSVRVEAILSATKRSGGIYLYANQSGCDGGRLFYDGCAMIAVNGNLIGLASQFSPLEVEVLVMRVSVESVRSFRASRPSRSMQASSSGTTVFPRVKADISLTRRHLLSVGPSPPIDPKLYTPAEELAFGPALWLWDILRNSSSAGFFVALSGGADSSSVAAIVGSMCQILMRHVREGSKEIRLQLETVLEMKSTEKDFPVTHRDLANRLLHTCFMGTENSSTLTRERARHTAADIGAHHFDTNIDPIIQAYTKVFQTTTGKTPHFTSTGPPGTTNAEDLALQNIQARSRMCLSYFLGSLVNWTRYGAVSTHKQRWLFVLATGNLDETLRGYFTKYDCSSGDLNPIGSVTKTSIIEFLKWAASPDTLGYSTLTLVANASPTAELRPHTSSNGDEHSQLDEVEMGMTYQELGWYGRVRKILRCGPVTMFQYMSHAWADTMRPPEIAEKVKHFFRTYASNRHKTTTLTPSYHAEAQNPESTLFDMRPFIYLMDFSRQFRVIDCMVNTNEQRISRLCYENIKRSSLQKF